MRIIIPARRGSKGFPGKNIKLFEYTAKIIPEHLKNRVTVLTDDPDISNLCKEWKFECLDRPEHVSNDTASTKSLIKWYIDHHIPSEQIDDFSPILVLYLTYPERTWKDVESAISLFETRGKSNSIVQKRDSNLSFPNIKRGGRP